MRLAVVALLLVSSAGFIQPIGSIAETRAKAVAPFLDENTLAVSVFDLSRPNVDELAFFFAADVPILGVQSNITVAEVKGLVASAKAYGAKDIFAIFNFALSSSMPVFVIPLGQTPNPKAVETLLAPSNFCPDFAGVRIGAAAVFGTKEACQGYQQLKPVPRPELARAMAAIKEMSCQVCIMLSPDARRAFEELIPTLPKELGGGPSKVLTRGMDWAVVGIDGLPRWSLQGVIQATSEADAGKVQDWLKAAAAARAKNLKSKDLPKGFDLLMAGEVTRGGDKLLLKLDHEQMAKLVQPLIAKSLFEADRKRAAASLRQIARAMHLHHDHKKGFPMPTIDDKDGKPLLSWRVQLLPYLEQDDLYSEFKLDEPWDSVQNKKLIARMPAVFRHPLGKGLNEGKTPFVVPVGKETLFPGGRGMKMPGDIPDGTSQTVMVFEAADEQMVIWTKPEDLPFDPKQPHRGLIDKSRPEFMAALADGSVHQLQNQISADTLRALITRNGNDIIGKDFYQGKR